jgi:hypothetical protein
MKWIMDNGINIVRVDDNTEFYKFQCFFILCDADEEELISNDSNIVDLSKFKPHFALKISLIIMDKVNIYIN